MKLLCYSILINILTSFCVLGNAQQFQSQHLHNAATKLGLDSTVLLKDSSTHFVNQNGQRLIIRVGRDNMIEHIGIPLFRQAYRTLQPSPIYDYLEYVTLDHKYNISDNTLQQKELKFLTGSWQILESLNDTLNCSIVNLQNKMYQVSWQQDGHNIVSVTFPINYELLANSNRREMESNFVRDLKNLQKTNAASTFHVDTALLKPYPIEGVSLLEGESHVIPSINSNLYVSVKKDNSQHLLVDNRYPAESMANLLLSRGASVSDATIQIEIVLDNYRKDTVVVDLDDWKAFYQLQGCQPYFGYEGVSKGAATGTLLLYNSQSGYDHIVHVSCATNVIGQEDMVLQARMYLFTPSTNVANLFGTVKSSSTKKSLIIWK